MATFDDDWIAFPHPVGILDELKAVLEERIIPVPSCFMGVVPGVEVALDRIGDDCENGMAYARVASVFPSANFPNQDPGPTNVWLMASVIEVGIMRRYVIPEAGETVTQEEDYDAARLQMADMAAMMQAICTWCDKGDKPVVLGQYQPYGPAGGIVGGSWTATIGAT